MEDALISVGKILKHGEFSYRIIFVSMDKIVLCRMDTTKLELTALSYFDINGMLSDGSAVLTEDEQVVFDVNKLTGKEKEQYENKAQVMREVEDAYGPTFLGLMGKGPKPQLTVILEKHPMPMNSFWRMVRKYLQGGMRAASLVDAKMFGLNKGKEYEYTTRTGRKPKNSVNHYLLTEEDKEHMAEALKWYASGHFKSKRAAFIGMCNKYYHHEELVNGTVSLPLLPPNQRPNLNQFYRYCEKHLTKEENDRIKTSAMEHRNNKRLLNSDALNGVYGPGDMVEIDAIEFDCSLVAPWDRNRTVGCPTVYTATDVRTRIVLAVSAAFDQNSLIGVSGLLINLAENKKEFCARYGVNVSEETIDGLWPSNIFPRRIRVDRGSEFTSEEFGRICNDLHIERNVISGGIGSLKGIEERLLGQLEQMQMPYTEGNGLRSKRHDSNHHKEAVLTINEFTNILINEILAYNQRYNASYPVDREMIEKGIRPIPAVMWKHWTDKFGAPRAITDIDHYRWTIMTPVNTKVSNAGITLEGLYYLADDPELDRERNDAGRHKKPFEARMDMRSVDAVYYLRNGRLIRAPLNENRAGMSSFKGLTMHEYRVLRDEKKAMDAEGDNHNQQIEANLAGVIESTIEAAQKSTYSETKNMRPARHKEKERVAAEGKIENRLKGEAPQFPEKSEDAPEALPETAHEEAPEDLVEPGYKDFDEALRDFRRRH